MKALDIPAGSLVRVVQSSEVEHLTREGWNVIGTVKDEEMVPCYDHEPRNYPPPNPNNTYQSYDSNGIVQCTRYRRQRQTKFVMTQGAESVTAELQGKINELCAALTAEKKAREELERAAKKAETDKQEAARFTRSVEEKYSGEVKERESLSKLAEGYRQDMEKIRRAIGTLGVEQILKNEKFTGAIEVVPEEKAREGLPDRFERVGNDG